MSQPNSKYPAGITPVRYRVDGTGPETTGAVYVEERIQRDGSTMWAVASFGSVLTKHGEWEYEPLPSSRTDEFIADTRWASLAEAVAAAKRACFGVTPESETP